MAIRFRRKAACVPARAAHRAPVRFVMFATFMSMPGGGEAHAGGRLKRAARQPRKFGHAAGQLARQVARAPRLVARGRRLQQHFADVQALGEPQVVPLAGERRLVEQQAEAALADFDQPRHQHGDVHDGGLLQLGGAQQAAFEQQAREAPCGAA